MNKLICQKCGGEISNDFNNTLLYCTNCGASLNLAAGDKTLVLPDSKTLLSPTPQNRQAKTRKTWRYLIGGLVLFGVSILAVVGLFISPPPIGTPKNYTCTIPGEPEPKTSEEFFERAQKHIKIVSGNGEPQIDDCALSALNEAIRLDANNTKALSVRGYTYNLRNQYDLAIADYDKAIQIEPNKSGHYEGRRYSFERKGLFDKAIEDQTTLINLLLQNNPPDWEKLSKEYKKRADLYAKNGDFANATKDLKEATRLFDKSANELIEKQNNNKSASKSENKNNETNLSNIPSKLAMNASQLGLPQPAYPPAAKAVRASGEVKVEVLIDETGSVVSAKAVSGHALLHAAAEQAALQAKFGPIVMNGKPTAVRAVILYNFVSE